MHAKPLLRWLHWLPVRQRVLYKMAVLTSAVSNESKNTSLPVESNC